MLFRQVTTDATGHALVRFDLSDDLTSWHVSADALTDALEAGSTWTAIPVGLPFFVDVRTAPEYLVTDRPLIRLRAYGSGLDSGSAVTFTVSSDTLGMAARTVTGTAFSEVQIALPALREGTHKILVEARAGSLSDRMARTFEVVPSRLLRNESSTETLGAGFAPRGGPGFTTYVFADAGRGRFLGTLQDLAWGDGPRLDQALAAAGARGLLAKYFPDVAMEAPPASFDVQRYLKSRATSDDENETEVPDGLALLPYASGDLDLSVRAALAAPDALLEASDLVSFFAGVFDSKESTPERRALALTGLAALGEPVLRQLQVAAAATGASPTTRLYIALGLQALGDDATALSIERDLLGRYGERYGSQVRLRVSQRPSDISEATALLAMLGAGLGDPIADAAERYVEANPSGETLLSLQQLSYVDRAIARAPAARASLAYVVGADRRVVNLGAGETFSLTLTPAQREILSAETLTGQVSVTTSWQAPFNPATAPIDPELGVVRTVPQSGALEAGAVVRVTFGLTFPRATPAGCYRLTETVPSGLVPLPASDWRYWIAETEEDGYGEVVRVAWPYQVQGQRVEWCVSPGDAYPPGYLARVVSRGTFTWEPAILQPAFAAERMALTPPSGVTVR